MGIGDFYFSPKKWEGTGKLYEMLGVLAFKKLVTQLGRKMGQKSTQANNYYLWQRDIAGLKKFEFKTRYNELMHLAGLIIPLIGLILGGNDLTTQIILWFVLLINIHPFALQRYNRIRIYRILENNKTTANKT